MQQLNLTPTPHELAGDDVLAVVLNDAAAWKRSAYVLRLSPALFATEAQRELYKAISVLHSTGKPIHDAAVLALSGGKVTLEQYYQIDSLYWGANGQPDTTRTGDVFDENAAIIRREGLTTATRRALKIADEQLASGKDRAAVNNNLMRVLAASGEQGVERERADEHGADFVDFMNSAAPPLVDTGIPWLNGLTGGFYPGRIWWIAGAYKQRKSTLMLNLALNAARAKSSVSILSREMGRSSVVAQLVAMLAIEYLISKDLYGRKYKSGDKEYPYNWISADALLQARAEYKRWNPEKVKAVEYGMDMYRSLGGNLRVYDTDPRHGGLSDYKSAEAVMLMDMNTHGGKVFFADYLQLFGEDGATEYERASAPALAFQRFTQYHGVTTVVLAQQNEAQISSDGKGYSPGIKGGSTPAQTADYLLITQYMREEGGDDTQLKVNMNKSRFCKAGSGVTEELTIHPGSGFIIPEKNIRRVNLESL